MRAGAVPLMAEMARPHRTLSDQWCMCGMTAVEDQMHMLVECEAYQHERNVMFHTLNTITDEVSSMTSNEKERLTLWLLSNVQ